MDVVWRNMHVVDDDFVHLRSPDERLLKKVRCCGELKGVAPVFWAPLEVELI